MIYDQFSLFSRLKQAQRAPSPPKRSPSGGRLSSPRGARPSSPRSPSPKPVKEAKEAKEAKEKPKEKPKEKAAPKAAAVAGLAPFDSPTSDTDIYEKGVYAWSASTVDDSMDDQVEPDTPLSPKV